MEDLISALQSTARSTYSKKEILHDLQSRQNTLNYNFEQKALKYAEALTVFYNTTIVGTGQFTLVHVRKAPNLKMFLTMFTISAVFDRKWKLGVAYFFWTQFDFKNQIQTKFKTH